MNQKILELLQSIQPTADFTHSEDFLEDGLIDSVDVIMVTAAIEKEFGISVPGDQITSENYASVERLAALVERCRQRRRG
jgi:acyl carrier protein